MKEQFVNLTGKLCECCRQELASYSDVRRTDETTLKLKVCDPCFQMDDEELFEVWFKHN